MDSDAPKPQDVSPQDPVRFSKSKSAPPILDLEAEAPRAAETADDVTKATASKHDRIQVGPPGASRLPLGGFVGGLIGGAIVALGVLAYAQFADQTSRMISSLQASLQAKSDRDELSVLVSRLSGFEASLGDVKSLMASSQKKITSPDAETQRRIQALEETVLALSANPRQSSVPSDNRSMRLILVFALRDAIRNTDATSQIIAALEKLGEDNQAFAILKSELSTPLLSYDELRDDVMTIMKLPPVEDAVKQSPHNSNSRLSDFFSQLITVRPASDAAKPASSDIAASPLLDAIDQNDAKVALSAIAALPSDASEKFKSVEGELKRRLSVETALKELFATSLDSIVRGNAP